MEPHRAQAVDGYRARRLLVNAGATAPAHPAGSVGVAPVQPAPTAGTAVYDPSARRSPGAAVRQRRGRKAIVSRTGSPLPAAPPSETALDGPRR